MSISNAENRIFELMNEAYDAKQKYIAEISKKLHSGESNELSYLWRPYEYYKGRYYALIEVLDILSMEVDLFEEEEDK